MGHIIEIDKNYMVSRFNFFKPSLLFFPARRAGVGHYQGLMIWYIHSSKTIADVGAGIYYEGTRMLYSYSLGQFATVFRQKSMLFLHVLKSFLIGDMLINIFISY